MPAPPVRFGGRGRCGGSRRSGRHRPASDAGRSGAGSALRHTPHAPRERTGGRPGAPGPVRWEHLTPARAPPGSCPHPLGLPPSPPLPLPVPPPRRRPPCPPRSPPRLRGGCRCCCRRRLREDVRARRLLPARAEQDGVGGAPALPEPHPRGLRRLRLRLVGAGPGAGRCCRPAAGGARRRPAGTDNAGEAGAPGVVCAGRGCRAAGSAPSVRGRGRVRRAVRRALGVSPRLAAPRGRACLA